MASPKKTKIAALLLIAALAWPVYRRARTVFLDGGAFRPPLSPDVRRDTEDFVVVTKKLASELPVNPRARWFVLRWTVFDGGTELHAEARYDRANGTLALWTEKFESNGKTVPWRTIGNYSDITDSAIQKAASRSQSLRQLQGYEARTVATIPRED